MNYKYPYPSGDVDLGAGTKKSVIKARIQSVEENLMDLLERREAKENEEIAKANKEIEKMATRAAKQELFIDLKKLIIALMYNCTYKHTHTHTTPGGAPTIPSKQRKSKCTLIDNTHTHTHTRRQVTLQGRGRGPWNKSW